MASGLRGVAIPLFDATGWGQAALEGWSRQESHDEYPVRH